MKAFRLGRLKGLRVYQEGLLLKLTNKVRPLLSPFCLRPLLSHLWYNNLIRAPIVGPQLLLKGLIVKTNNANIFKKCLCWFLVILWTGIIFFLSSQTAPESNGLSGETIRALVTVFMPGYAGMSSLQQSVIVASLQHVVRNAAHVLVYVILSILCMSALLQHELKTKVRIFATLAICGGYALTDELHQLFVTGRAFELTDLGLDLTGTLIGLLLIIGVWWLRRRKSLETSGG